MINKLPVEILLGVYEYLNYADLVLISSISKQLQISLQHPIVWKRAAVVLGQDKLLCSNSMTALRIPHRNSRIGKFMHLVRKLNCQNDTGFQSLSLLIPRMINLTTINFSNNTNINDDCIRLIASYCPNLESLNVSKCYCLTHKALYYIAKQFRYLKSLNISSTGCVNDKSWIVLCVLNDTLKHLNMASCYNLNWYNVHKIYPSSLATWDISNNCRLNFDYLAGIADIRSKSDITDTLLITCKNCESLTLGELSQLEGISDAKMKFISNSLLKDYSSEGVREYIKLLLGV